MKGKFQREVFKIGAVDTVVYTAGKGDPVVFFHGAGTLDGFDFTEAWVDRFRVIAPYHPGFGESGDDPEFSSLQDYVMHYLELFDALHIDRFHLVGLSMGGQLAAMFAAAHGHRVKKLVLVAPSGIVDPEHPTLDILAIPGEQIPGLLTSDFSVIQKRLPEKPSLDFVADRYRETTTFARLSWEHPRGDPKLMRYLHRLKTPTLILWGDEDKIVPVQQAQRWKELTPGAEVRVFKGAGHLVHLERPEALEAITRFLASA